MAPLMPDLFFKVRYSSPTSSVRAQNKKSVGQLAIEILIHNLLSPTFADPVAPVNSTALVNSTGPITFEKVSVGVFATVSNFFPQLPSGRDFHHLYRFILNKYSYVSQSQCAISTGPADLYCMGDNDDGIIGDGTFTWRQIPTKSSLAGPWRDVTAGDWHACGTKEDNTGYCWGYNGGRLGLGLPDPVQANTPQKLFSSWKTVSAGHFHSCAIRIDGLAFCWGNNKNGRLGIGR